MTERAEIVGRCERCGRDFVTLPTDGMDHYGPRQYGTNISMICGGAVKPLPARGERVKSEEGT